ncbi:MAG: TolC family protein [Bacteroidota bacterium]
MFNYIKYYLLAFAGLASLNMQAQSILTLDQAIQQALQNNYDIRIKQYDVDISAKRIDPALVGRKPTVDLNVSYEFGYGDASTETLNLAPNAEGNSQIDLDGISSDFIIAPEINLMLWDGKASLLRLDQLTELNNMSRLQLQQTIEQTVATVTAAYLEMAQQKSLLDITTESIAFNKNRLDRARQDAKYGTSGSLQALQIEVDLKTDSAALRNLNLGYENARRNLNQLMGSDS